MLFTVLYISQLYCVQRNKTKVKLYIILFTYFLQNIKMYGNGILFHFECKNLLMIIKNLNNNNNNNSNFPTSFFYFMI